jgi:hypothetical protein
VDRVTLDFMRAGREPESFTGGLRSLRYPVIKRLAATSSPGESRALVELMERMRALLRAELAGSLSDGDRFRLGYRLSQGTILLADDVFEVRR